MSRHGLFKLWPIAVLHALPWAFCCISLLQTEFDIDRIWQYSVLSSGRETQSWRELARLAGHHLWKANFIHWCVQRDSSATKWHRLRNLLHVCYAILSTQPWCNNKRLYSISDCSQLKDGQAISTATFDRDFEWTNQCGISSQVCNMRRSDAKPTL